MTPHLVTIPRHPKTSKKPNEELFGNLLRRCLGVQTPIPQAFGCLVNCIAITIYVGSTSKGIIVIITMNLGQIRMKQKQNQLDKSMKYFDIHLVGGFNPSEKILVKMGIFPK